MQLKHFTHVVCFVALIISLYEADAQYSRRMTSGDIGWYNLFTTFSITPKTGLHFEYQWRRDDYVFNWQQSLLRTGVNFAPNPRVMFRLGYAWIETFNYGEIPLNSLGRDFTEHRIFEMVQLSHKEGRFEFSHRFMAEQRFVGRYNKIDSPREDEYPLLNRMRYMFRVQCPLKGKEMIDNTPYVAFYDEVMIGFGENVAANVFDQNRIGLLIGYRKSSYFKVEVGYLNQFLQFGRLVNEQHIFQNNNGLILNIILQPRFRKPDEK